MNSSKLKSDAELLKSGVSQSARKKIALLRVIEREHPKLVTLLAQVQSGSCIRRPSHEEMSLQEAKALLEQLATALQEEGFGGSSQRGGPHYVARTKCEFPDL